MQKVIPPMRIVTYNIHGWRTSDGEPNLAAIGDLLIATGADVIGLNEVFYPRAIPGTARPALELLAERLQMHFVFGPCLRWPAQEGMPPDAYGNALLSRWPILADAAHHLTPKAEDREAILADKEQRGLLEARILLPDQRTLTVYVTHLDHTSEAARLLQLRVAQQWLLRDRNRPHLVMGDFNAISLWDFAARTDDLQRLADHPKGQNLTGNGKGPQVIAQMAKYGYVDLMEQVGLPGQQSYIGAADNTIRIDYIFATSDLAADVRTCAVWQEAPGAEASDHRPLLAEFAAP